MIARDTLIVDLEDAIARGSSDRRVETLRRVTDLFLGQAPAFSEAQVQLFDDVIGRLADQIEAAARAELAEKLGPVANAPIEVVKRLARDEELAVAAPILSQSPRLDDDDLVDIASSRGQGHLLAISERPTLASTVTDVLVARGDQQVVRSVAGNAGARFSDMGFATLVKRSAGDSVLQERVGLRKDIPPQHFRAILAQATDAVQRRLLAAAGTASEGIVRQVVAGAAERLSGETGLAPRDYRAAQQLVATLVKVGKLGESELADFAKAGKFEETVCALSSICQVPIEVVERLMVGDRPDPVLILCKAAGFGWSTVRSVILVRPMPGGISAGILDEAFDNFERLSAATAQRVIRFWQVRQVATR